VQKQFFRNRCDRKKSPGKRQKTINKRVRFGRTWCDIKTGATFGVIKKLGDLRCGIKIKKCPGCEILPFFPLRLYFSRKISTASSNQFYLALTFLCLFHGEPYDVEL
jgi:hypothetical protein